MSSGAHGWQSLLADADVGWHIRTGEYILDHHQVPHHDLYSFSKPGAPWYAWEWLTDIIDGLLFRWAGLKGIVLAAGALIALFASTLMRRVVDAGAHLFVALLCIFRPRRTYLRCCCSRFQWESSKPTAAARVPRASGGLCPFRSSGPICMEDSWC
jgi:hypothetical protein